VGDLHVHVHVEIPKTLSARAEQLLRELAAEEQQEVSPKRSSFFSRLGEYFQAKEPEAADEPRGARTKKQEKKA
jgi:DnaJ-class molecular chaperone